MRPHTLKFKVGLWLAVALTVAVLAFATAVVHHQRDALLAEAEAHVAQLSEVITKSTRFAMLQNQPSYVTKILQDVGAQASIDKIRIFSKKGTIIHSSLPAEIGHQVDKKAEACFHCHRSEQPLRDIPTGDRSRVFAGVGGERLLGTMEVIRNEPSCSNGGCHVHGADQSVLGVLDIVYSLDDIEHTLRGDTATVVALAIGFVLVASLLVSLFVHRMVYVPLSDLEAGAKRIAGGDLEQLIPVRSGDEFGRLAESFNSMTVALGSSKETLQEWGHSLEQKVEERTRELRVAQAEAARGERLASLGLLAAGVAHELNNPLTGVLTFSHLVRDRIPDGTPEAEDVDLVIRETKRCATIIRRLLDFAREKPPEMKYVDLNALVEETAELVERPARFSDISMAMDLAPDLPQIWIDENLIKQVIMNMLVNAQYAIGDSGTVTVRTRVCPEPKSPEPVAEPVPMVELSVIDDGCGIPAADLQRVFDPFFTSKGVGKGTGLGLSVSHGTVRAHGGTIEVESTPGEGTTFRVYLPIGQGAAELDGSVA